MAGALYVVSTPIGNLEDITLRALRILREADIIAAEDTRVTRKLLSRYEIHTPLTSCHQHSRGEKVAGLLARLQQGQSIALVSDAGTPSVSDPGAELVGAAIAHNVAVVPVPGPSAALAALVASGLPAGRFAFDGFAPRTRTDRREFFRGLQAERRTIVLYEAPRRVAATLAELLAALGDRPVALARELTKAFEEVYRGTLSGAVEHVGARGTRGEYTIVVGPPPPDAGAEAPSADDVSAALARQLDAGATPRDAVQEVAARLSLPRRLVYRALLDLQHER